ncbi:sensor histidine kinase [Sphingoaurantiacus capsulatus]|uniref:Sensor histidine kinase n=1 Tax=Sphingoaurantiacus capsulatus TaxID=1771310 RepID=A0ABV7XAL9_9SPHN
MANNALNQSFADPVRVPWRATALSIVGFWLFYFFLNTLKNWFAHAPDQLWMMERRAVVTLAGMGLSALLYFVLRAADGRSTRYLLGTAFLASIPITIAYATINHIAFYYMLPDTMLVEMAEKKPDEGSTLSMILWAASGWYFFIAAWAVLYVALSYATRVQVVERRAAQYRNEAQTAELRALRYQVNPHFLFNTLNALSSLVMAKREEEAERMIMNLSTFFRTSLTSDPAQDVSLADEIRLQKLYLDIERVRFPRRLNVEIDVPPALETARVPGLILQPLVENAIKYGVSRSTGKVHLSIRARALDGRMQLIVEDDGKGDGPTEPGHGVGLRNVSDRLDTRFGRTAQCESGPRKEGGWRVVLTMPLEFHDRD